jgi:hypothetical protein
MISTPAIPTSLESSPTSSPRGLPPQRWLQGASSHLCHPASRQASLSHSLARGGALDLMGGQQHSCEPLWAVGV